MTFFTDVLGSLPHKLLNSRQVSPLPILVPE